MKNIIHIYGASGAGTTTLGKAINKKYGHSHLDTDDYFWLPTNPLFTTPREREERTKMLDDDITKSDKCVITGSLCGWGDVFIPEFKLCVWLITPTDVRIERLKKREFSRFGDRILTGGDMYENHTEFIEWAKTYDTDDITERSYSLHYEWKEKLTCPLLILDGTKHIDELIVEMEKI